MNESKILKMPKIELHLHLDGSLDINYIKNEYNLTDSDVKEKMIADEKCKNLNDYLVKFDFPISIMQTKEELESAIYNLALNLKKDNVIYAEVRFAPQFHTRKGLTQDEVVKILIDKIKEIDGIKINLILCIMRGNSNEKENFETINVAKKYLGKGVCAIDLAGAEGLFPTSNYEREFAIAKENNIPFTIHAGEAAGPDSIRAAISFGAKRIGHGVRVIEYSNLIEDIIKNNITLEVCPTSNIQTCICSNYSTHPISKLYKLGVKTTINTDNMTVSNTNLSNEYIKLIDNTDLKYEDIVKMNLNSIDASFLNDDEKNNLKEKYIKEEKIENK